MLPLDPPRPRLELPQYPFAGQLEYQGIPIDVETAAGEYREGVDEAGKAWRVKMPAHYGEARGTIGSDGDAVDVFVGPDPFSPWAFVCQTKNPKTGAYDETKTALGYQTQAEATAMLRSAYDVPVLMGVTKWPIGAWAAALQRPEVSVGRMEKPLAKADPLVNLELAEQLSLFANRPPPGPLPLRRSAAPVAQAPTPPWIQVAPFTRKGGIAVKAHIRRHVPGGHFEPTDRPARRRAHLRPVESTEPPQPSGPAVDAARAASWRPSHRDVFGEAQPGPPRWLGYAEIVQNLSGLRMGGAGAPRIRAGAVAKVPGRKGAAPEWWAVAAYGDTQKDAQWYVAHLGEGETPPWEPLPAPAVPETAPEQGPTLTPRDAFRLRRGDLERIVAEGGPNAAVAAAELARREAKRTEGQTTDAPALPPAPRAAKPTPTPKAPEPEPQLDDPISPAQAHAWAQKIRQKGQALIDKWTEPATSYGTENTAKRLREAEGRRSNARRHLNRGERMVRLANATEAGTFAPTQWDVEALSSERHYSTARAIAQQDHDVPLVEAGQLRPGEGVWGHRYKPEGYFEPYTTRYSNDKGDPGKWNRALASLSRYADSGYGRTGYRIPASDTVAVEKLSAAIRDPKVKEALGGFAHADHVRDLRVYRDLGFLTRDNHAVIAGRFNRLKAASGKDAAVAARWPPPDRSGARRPFEERMQAAEAAEAKRWKAPEHQQIRGYFPTPHPVVEEMIERADIHPGMTVLEPSAGTGEIADHLPADVQITTAEASPTLRDVLKQKGYAPGTDALNVAGTFDRVVMNPPFEDGQDMAHVRHAFEHNLAPGGRLVAIVGNGALHNSRAVNDAFRAFLDEHRAEEDQPIDPAAWKRSGTAVGATMITLEKPREYAMSKASAELDMMLAEQLGLFGHRAPIPGGPMFGGRARPAAPAAPAPTHAPWIRVGPFTRKGGIAVRAHFRKYIPGEGDTYAPVHQPEPEEEEEEAPPAPVIVDVPAPPDTSAAPGQPVAHRVAVDARTEWWYAPRPMRPGDDAPSSWRPADAETLDGGILHTRRPLNYRDAELLGLMAVEPADGTYQPRRFDGRETGQAEDEVGRTIGVQDSAPPELFAVLDSRRGDFLRNVEAIRKRAEKLNLDAPVVTEIGRLHRTVPVELIGWGDHARVRSEKRSATLYHIVGPKLQVKGWTAEAVIKPVPGTDKTTILRIGKATDLPIRLWTTGMHCDQCGADRQRGFVVALRSVSGAWQQVGGTCLADFTGRSAAQLASNAEMLANWWKDKDGDLDSYDEDLRGPPTHHDLHSVLMASIAVIAETGRFVSAKEAEREMTRSTANDVADLLRDPTVAGKILNNKEYALRAKAISEWMRSIPLGGDGNEYKGNLHAIGHASAVGPGQLGMAVSAVVAYERDMGAKPLINKAGAVVAMTRFAKVGDMIGGKTSAADRKKGIERHPPRMVKVIARDVQKGFRPGQLKVTLHLRDAAGHVFVWQSSADSTAGGWDATDLGPEHQGGHTTRVVDVGETFRLNSATVDGYGTWKNKDGDETKITRANITRVYTPSERKLWADTHATAGEEWMDEIGAKRGVVQKWGEESIPLRAQMEADHAANRAAGGPFRPFVTTEAVWEQWKQQNAPAVQAAGFAARDYPPAPYDAPGVPSTEDVEHYAATTAHAAVKARAGATVSEPVEAEPMTKAARAHALALGHPPEQDEPPAPMEKAMNHGTRILIARWIPMLALLKAATPLAARPGLQLVASAKNPTVKRWMRTTRQWVDKLPHLPEDTLEHYKKLGGEALTSRQALREKIIGQMIDHVKPAPEGKKPTAVVMMGGTASGKSTATRRLGYADDEYVRLDADWVKEQLPEFHEAAKPREKGSTATGEVTARNAALMVHEESTEAIMKVARDRAIAAKKPIIMDGTGADAYKYGAFIDHLKSQGYHVHLIMTDLDASKAKVRSAGRAEHSGRHVPHHIIDSVYQKAPKNFQAMAAKAHDATLWDNRPKGGRVVWQRKADVEHTHDPKFMAKFKQQHYTGGGEADMKKAKTEMKTETEKPPSHSADEVNARIARALAFDHEEHGRPRPAKKDRHPTDDGITWPDDDRAFDMPAAKPA